MARSSKSKRYKDRPDLAAALRDVVWEHKHTGVVFSLEELERKVTESRQRMGLQTSDSGHVSTLIQQRFGKKVRAAMAEDKRPALHYVAAQDVKDWSEPFSLDHG